MRSILFKKADSQQFEKYIDIGYCKRDFYFICIFLNEYNEDRSGKNYYATYNDWFLDFQSNEIGSQLITLNYYILEYKQCENSIKFGEIYGQKIAKVFFDNLLEFSFCNVKWFYDDSSLFQGLDLGLEYDELEEIIESKIKNDLGFITEIKFKDGSEIKFLDEDDTIQSFYVMESDFEFLKNQLISIVEKFK